MRMFFLKEIDRLENKRGFRRDSPWKDLMFTRSRGGLRIRVEREIRNGDGRNSAEYKVSSPTTTERNIPTLLTNMLYTNRVCIRIWEPENFCFVSLRIGLKRNGLSSMVFLRNDSNHQNIFVDSSRRRVDLEVFGGTEFKSSFVLSSLKPSSVY